MPHAVDPEKTNGSSRSAPPPMTLPYAEFSHALMCVHHDALAMAAANRVLADSLRAVVRRQQDLAFELAEVALNVSHSGISGNPSAIFERAAAAVREVGEAIIEAQIEALRIVQAEAAPRQAARASTAPRPPAFNSGPSGAR